MVSKAKIVKALGEEGLVLPERIALSLRANDQVKYYFALLQTARANSDRPQVPTPDLKAERLASQIKDSWLDSVVAQARKEAAGRYRIPHAGEIAARIGPAIADMLACLPGPQRSVFEERLKQLTTAIASGDEVDGNAIDAMTSGNRKAGDSPHVLVMDAHRVINALQAETATETLSGARVFTLSARSRKLVTAFMAGLNRTAVLKFDHPGLATTATEHDGRLLIQNDIGTTDAHVLVLRVAGREATLTYTDIHKARLKFFASLFSDFAVEWQQTDTRTSTDLENAAYLLTTATYKAETDADLMRYLEHLGSRIVYLIDWNKMRKRLRAFVSKERAVEVLRWAAENDFGHRGLLEIGGEAALAEAIEYAAGDGLRYGDRLDGLIGEKNAVRFLRRALQCASIGMRQGRSRRLILDEIKAELRHYFETSRLKIFDVAARHAETGFDLATALREALDAKEPAGHDSSRFARRAADWEQRADQILNEARDDIRKFRLGPLLLKVFEHADDAVDELEDAASLLTLVEFAPPGAEASEGLRQLGDVALACAQELVKSIECAATISRSDVREDFDDFLTCIGRLTDLEHQADVQLRTMRAQLMASTESARGLFLAFMIAQALETASDAYAHAGQALRHYLLEEVLA